MAKNNGKFTLFFMLCALVLALCLVIGMDKCEYTAKKAVFETSNRVNTNLVENNINLDCNALKNMILEHLNIKNEETNNRAAVFGYGADTGAFVFRLCVGGGKRQLEDCHE